MTDAGNRRLFLTGLLVAIAALAVVAAQFASSNPDGLEFVAEQEGFLDTETRAPSGALFADYGEDLTSSGWLNTAIAGLAGVLLTLAIGYGVFWLARRKQPGDRAAGPS